MTLPRSCTALVRATVSLQSDVCRHFKRKKERHREKKTCSRSKPPVITEQSLCLIWFCRSLKCCEFGFFPHFMQTLCTQNSRWAGITEKDGERLIPKDYTVSLQYSQSKNRFWRAHQCHQASKLLLNQNLLKSCLRQCQFSTREKQHNHSSTIFYVVTF